MRTTVRNLVASLLLVSVSALAQGDGATLHNVALRDLGATAKGSGAHFNKDWPPIGTLNEGSRGGTIFDPFEGAIIDIRLVIPVEIKALEIVGLDYRGTRLPSGVDVFIEGEKVAHSGLPDIPGHPTRIDAEGHGQTIRLVACSMKYSGVFWSFYSWAGPDRGWWLRWSWL